MTTEQLELDIAPLIVPTHAPDATIQDRFDAFHAANPWVLHVIEQRIRTWLAKGHTRVEMKQVWEVVRWEYGATTGQQFKANNDFTSRYARLVLERHPEWASAIETRALRA